MKTLYIVFLFVCALCTCFAQNDLEARYRGMTTEQLRTIQFGIKYSQLVGQPSAGGALEDQICSDTIGKVLQSRGAAQSQLTDMHRGPNFYHNGGAVDYDSTKKIVLIDRSLKPFEEPAPVKTISKPPKALPAVIEEEEPTPINSTPRVIPPTRWGELVGLTLGLTTILVFVCFGLAFVVKNWHPPNLYYTL